MIRDVALFGATLKAGMRKRGPAAFTKALSKEPVVSRTLPLASEIASRYGAATFRSL